jgi:hypothetical protein
MTSVTSIGAGAFYDCTRLTNVTIPNSVTSTGGSALTFGRVAMDQKALLPFRIYLDVANYDLTGGAIHNHSFLNANELFGTNGQTGGRGRTSFCAISLRNRKNSRSKGFTGSSVVLC